jgi:hypothetical protein
MTALLAVLVALMSFGGHVPHPSSCTGMDPNGSCPGAIHVHFSPACSANPEPNGGCAPGTVKATRT